MHAYRTWYLAWTLLATASIAAAAACSSDDAASVADAGAVDAPVAEPPADGASDAGDFGAISTTYPAYRASMPTAKTNGGPTLTDFKVVPVTFSSDTEGQLVPQFLTRYAASPEWAAQVKEYGVGTMTVAPAVVLSEVPPASQTNAATQAWLRAKLDGSHPEFGPNDSASLRQTVFVLVYPSSTKLLDSSGRKSCVVWSGYHSTARAVVADAGGFDADLDADVDAGDGASDASGPNDAGDADDAGGGLDDSTPVLFVAAPRCTNLLEQTQTSVIAHELIETATNPFSTVRAAEGGGLAYYDVDIEHIMWHLALGGGEVADLCNVPGSYYAPAGIDAKICRSWSNAAAGAGLDPCVPTPPDEPYFNAFIMPPEKFALSGAGEQTLGALVAVGHTRTFDVLLSSDRATGGPWEVRATEVRTVASNPLALTLSLDRKQGQNGEKVHLTITANTTTPTKTTGIGITSVLGKKQTFWFMPIGLHQ